MDTEMAEKEFLYLYCVTDKVPKLKEIENLAEKLYFIYYQGLYAVVSTVKENEFSEESLKKNLADMNWLEHKAGIHEKIIEGVMKNSCIIPFKFATIFNSEDNLKTMLGQHSGGFKEILKQLEDKEEWGLKIYADLEKLKEVLLQEDGELLNLDKEISSSPPGKAFILKKKKEELLNKAVNKKLNEYGQANFEKINQYAVDSRINKLLPREVTEREDEMILNSAFLFDRNKVNDLLKAVGDLKIMFNGKGLFFDCTGPWPPYNFCQMKPRPMEQK